MKVSSAREDIFIVFLSFWSTILLTRYLTFEFIKVFHQYPVLYLSGVPIHHFLVGLILVSFVLVVRIFRNSFSLINLILLGMGLGFITDEFWLITTGDFTTNNIYWAGENLTAIVVLGLLSFLFVKFLERRSSMKLDKGNRPLHVNPKNPLVSVVIPALNEEKFLENNLYSIIQQKFKDFELIVVDNNSTDRTAEIARSFGAKVIFNAVKGVGAARQAGFMAAKGKIIATTDADNILPRDWLETIVKRFEKDPELVAFGGLFRLYSGPLSARIAVKYLSYHMFKLDKLFAHNWSLIAQNMAVKKSAFLKVGGFKHVQMGEDADLAQRLGNIGKVELDPNFLVYASGRRVRHGLWYGIWSYGPNAFSRMFFKKHKFDRLPTVRKEKSIINNFSFIPLLASVIYLIILFTSMNASLNHAKQDLLHKTSISISKMKLKKIASELGPTLPWSELIKKTRDLHFLEN
ncbi:MAG: glycosyltransferase family 2 protein [Candidatus Levyibacteriota bacterium]